MVQKGTTEEIKRTLQCKKAQHIRMYEITLKQVSISYNVSADIRKEHILNLMTPLFSSSQHEENKMSKSNPNLVTGRK